MWLPTYSIDRTEVSNAAVEVFERGASVHGTWLPSYPAPLAEAAGPNHPRTDIDWSEARSYCRYMGKALPSFEQWQKALRGGLVLPDGTNPFPRRTYPWGDPGAWHSVAIELAESVPVGSYPDDRSPYGVMDLAGNVEEWLSDDLSSDKDVRRRQRAVAGGDWRYPTRENLREYIVDRNARSPRLRVYLLGFRCVLNTDGALGERDISHR
jgi:formylglycine-generating enzyme required for sulfatase activity